MVTVIDIISWFQQIYILFQSDVNKIHSLQEPPRFWYFNLTKSDDINENNEKNVNGTSYM